MCVYVCLHICVYIVYIYMYILYIIHFQAILIYYIFSLYQVSESSMVDLHMVADEGVHELEFVNFPPGSVIAIR